MAFQSAPNMAEIIVSYTGHSQEFKNIMHAHLPGGYDLADLTALGVAIDAEVAAEWLPLQSLDYLYNNTTVRGLEFINDQEVINNTSSAVGGKDAGAMPDNVTLSIKKVSGVTGRSGRGRLYWIGTHEGDIASNENSYTTVAALAITAAVDDMRIAIDSTVWDAAILSRFTNGLKRPFGVPFDWISTVAVNNNVDSQRRRLIN